MSRSSPSAVAARSSARDVLGRLGASAATFSKIVARPWPTPTHSVGDAVAPAAAAQLADQRAEQAGARAAERVAERDRAAVDVELLRASMPSSRDAGEHLGGEGLVELDQVDVVDRQAGALERLAGRAGTGPMPM